ncbi:MAG: 4Fe-4S ferredoxin [Candidatus Hydrogenedentes bacterium]|nr:4Fe-4S ferredoxin [Candidatus Hydrogenedentota bacterium]
MKMMRKIVQIDERLCNGCGKCVPSCAEGALVIENGKARLVADRCCDGLGACLGECPTGAIQVIEREAEPFDETLAPAPAAAPRGHACPGAQSRVLAGTPAAAPASVEKKPSALGNWPVQIRLVPPGAPWLQGAHLLVAADCVPVASPAFHDTLLAGKVVVLGCPKFDPAGEYAHKFGEIFSGSEIARVTVAVMEVPCCQGLPRIVQAGMAMAGKAVPMNVAVIGFDGAVRETRQAGGPP